MQRKVWIKLSAARRLRSVRDAAARRRGFRISDSDRKSHGTFYPARANRLHVPRQKKLRDTFSQPRQLPEYGGGHTRPQNACPLGTSMLRHRAWLPPVSVPRAVLLDKSSTLESHLKTHLFPNSYSSYEFPQVTSTVERY